MEDIGTILFTVLIGITVFNVLKGTMAKDTKALEALQVDRCPPHKWEYDHQGKMLCGKCYYVIGANSGEDNE